MPTIDPFLADPTRTKTLREKFEQDIARRHRKLMQAINRLLLTQDALGKRRNRMRRFTINRNGYINLAQWIAVNTDEPLAWSFLSDSAKVEEFEKWLQVETGLTIVPEGDRYWEQYIVEGYQKGAGRAYTDATRRQAVFESLQFGQGRKTQFITGMLNGPESVEKLKILAARVFTDLKGVNGAMATQMRRHLVDGLAQGQHPTVMARSMAQSLGIARKRANTIARTEIIRAHAEGSLDALERMGVEEVGVAVEWSTAGDTRVCPLCIELEGVILKVKEAHSLIPRHPNCRCAFVPANVGEVGRSQQVRSKTGIQDAVRESLAKEGGKHKSTWAGKEKVDKIDKVRPKSILDKPKKGTVTRKTVTPKPLKGPEVRKKSTAKPTTPIKPASTIPPPLKPTNEWIKTNTEWLEAQEKIQNRGGHNALNDFVNLNKHRDIRWATEFYEKYGYDVKKTDNPFNPKGLDLSYDNWERNRKKSAKWKRHSKAIKGVIDKGPNYQGRLVRGMNIEPNVANEMIEKGVYETSAITSWSKDIKHTEPFSGGRDTGWKFFGDFKGNANSADVSFSGGEQEVLTGKVKLKINYVDYENRVMYVTDH